MIMPQSIHLKQFYRILKASLEMFVWLGQVSYPNFNKICYQRQMYKTDFLTYSHFLDGGWKIILVLVRTNVKPIQRYTKVLFF